MAERTYDWQLDEEGEPGCDLNDRGDNVHLQVQRSDKNPHRDSAGFYWWIEIDDGVPNRDDGLPTTLFETDGEADTIDAAKAAAIAAYEARAAETERLEAKWEAQIAEAEAAGAAAEASGLYDQPIEER